MLVTMLPVTLVSILPLLADTVTTFAALAVFAIALRLRRLRRRVLRAPLPSFLTVAPLAPLSITTDLLATGLFAGLVLVVRESWIPGATMLLATGALFLFLGSLRGQLLVAGLAGLTGGHGRARGALLFFDALRHTWRARRLVPAIVTGMVVCGADFAAVYLILGFVLHAGLYTALAVTCAIRLCTVLLTVSRAAGDEAVARPDADRQPVSSCNDLAA